MPIRHEHKDFGKCGYCGGSIYWCDDYQEVFHSGHACRVIRRHPVDFEPVLFTWVWVLVSLFLLILLVHQLLWISRQ